MFLPEHKATQGGEHSANLHPLDKHGLLMDSNLNLDITVVIPTKLLYDNRLVYNCKTHKLNVQILYIQAGTHRCANTNPHYLSSMCSYDEETHLHDILSCVQ